MLGATRRSCARGLSRVLMSCHQNPLRSYSTNAPPAQLAEKPSKDAVPGKLWVPNQYFKCNSLRLTTLFSTVSLLYPVLRLL
ncbi:hypothetical protein AgCh_022369 [Apium graveolens]